MIETFLTKLRHQLDKLWARITAISVLSLFAIVLARLIGPLLPDGINEALGAGSVGDILRIIANSMLAVTTFSLTVMVTVYRSASSQWTPRVHRLMMDDKITQNTLATFVGAYIFALASIILLNTELFEDDNLVVLFGFTILVVVLIVLAIVRWILHLQTLGSLIETTRRVEKQAEDAFETRMGAPCLDGHALTDPDQVPGDAVALMASSTKYIRFVYHAAIAEKAAEHEVDVYLVAPVGRFMYPGEPMAYLSRKDDELEKVIYDNILLGDLRGFEQDPRFGMIVLSEIASKALSPGINDAGTAIDVIGRMARLLARYRGEVDRIEDPPRHARLWVPPIAASDLIRDAFDPIARDGAAMVEVQEMLLRTLRALSNHPDPDLSAAAQEAGRRAHARAEGAMALREDLEQISAGGSAGSRAAE